MIIPSQSGQQFYVLDLTFSASWDEMQIEVVYIRLGVLLSGERPPLRGIGYVRSCISCALRRHSDDECRFFPIEAKYNTDTHGLPHITSSFTVLPF